MFARLCLLVLLLAHAAIAFTALPRAGTCISTQLYSSYADRLAAAKAKKAGGVPQPPVSPPAVQQAPQKIQQSASPRAPPAAAVVPFTDEVQGHLQDAIALLSGRLQSGEPLNPEEFSRFERSIGAIIVDALAHLSVGSAAAPPAAARPAPGQQRQQASARAPASRQSEAIESFDDADNESEGPAWDPEKGYGVASGTRNVSTTSTTVCWLTIALEARVTRMAFLSTLA